MRRLLTVILAGLLSVAGSVAVASDHTATAAVGAPSVAEAAGAKKKAATKFATKWHRKANARNWTWLKKHSTKDAVQGFKGQAAYLKSHGYGVLKFGKKTQCSRGYGAWACWTNKSAPCELVVKRRHGRWIATAFYLYD